MCLLTFPRVLGFGFYPVSFWYCFHADGTPRAVLAEVHNTFGGHHNYLLHNHGDEFDWQSRNLRSIRCSGIAVHPDGRALRVSAHRAVGEAARGYL